MNKLAWVLRWSLALVLAIAAGLKIGNHPGGETLLGSLHPVLQWTIVGVELGIAGWIVSGLWPKVSGYAAIMLFSAFLAVILINMNSPQPKDCGCFGKLAPSGEVMTNLKIMLGVDVVLLGLALALYYLPARSGVSGLEAA